MKKKRNRRRLSEVAMLFCSSLSPRKNFERKDGWREMSHEKAAVSSEIINGRQIKNEYSKKEKFFYSSSSIPSLLLCKIHHSHPSPPFLLFCFLPAPWPLTCRCIFPGFSMARNFLSIWFLLHLVFLFFWGGYFSCTTPAIDTEVFLWKWIFQFRAAQYIISDSRSTNFCRWSFSFV